MYTPKNFFYILNHSPLVFQKNFFGDPVFLISRSDSSYVWLHLKKHARLTANVLFLELLTRFELVTC